MAQEQPGAGDAPLAHDPIAWLEANVTLRPSDAAEFWYERMESQSGRSLPVIYEPFAGHKRSHFIDRGQILDFAACLGGGRLLDFGPGDGWPSLLIAPLAGEVIGVDGSRRRVGVCAENARRLGIANARFVHVPPGQPLPFADQSFDGVAAASSIEQTPDPQATLRELWRVLRPGGRLRMHYESLGYYRGGQERELVLGERDERPARALIFDRDIAGERARHYGLLFAGTGAELECVFADAGAPLSYAGLTPRVLSALCARLVEAVTWSTRHPSCRTLLAWLAEAGFRRATPTHNGGWFAGRLFDRLGEDRRPKELEAVDALLRPLVAVVVEMEAPPGAGPGEWEPWLTAVK